MRSQKRVCNSAIRLALYVVTTSAILDNRV
jgi:hypothetical protein